MMTMKKMMTHSPSRLPPLQPQQQYRIVVVLLCTLIILMTIIPIHIVDGRRLGTPITLSSSSTTTTTASRSLNFLNSILTTITAPSNNESNDLDQVNEYDNDLDSTGSSGMDETNTMMNSDQNNNHQIIVRFDNDNTTTNHNNEKIVLTRAEIEVRAQQVAQHLGGTVLQIYEHVFYGATIGHLPSPPPITTTTSSSSSSTSLVDNTSSTLSGARTFVSDTGSEIPNFSYETDVPIGGRSISTIYDTTLNTNINVQSNAPGSLDRINQSTLPLDHTYKYKYDGTGVTVFVVDTGIRTTHVDLQHTNVICGYSAFPVTNTDDGSSSSSIDGACDDEAGHGTHVAGTIASQTYGVAKRATLVTVKVLDRNGNGSYTTLLGGIEYMIQYRTMYPSVPMVANLSLGAGYSTAINDAVTAAIRNNIVMVVAAGNDSTDACTKSPASTPSAITVGASRSTPTSKFSRLLPFRRRKERRTEYSNYGNCVDIFAWGSNVLSLGISSPTSIVSKSGTSMATPHVTGTVALYLHRNPHLTPEEVQTLLISDATTAQLQTLHQKKSPNRTLNTQNII